MGLGVRSDKTEGDANQAVGIFTESRTVAIALWVIIGVCVGAAVGTWGIPRVPTQNPPMAMKILLWFTGWAVPEVKEHNAYYLLFTTAVAGGVLFGWIAKLRYKSFPGPSLSLLAWSTAAASLLTPVLVFSSIKYWMLNVKIEGPRFDLALLTLVIAAIPLWVWLKTWAVGRTDESAPQSVQPVPRPFLADSRKPSLARRFIIWLRRAVTWRDPLIFLVLLATIWVPDPLAEAQIFWNNEKLHHWNFFMLGPGLHVKAGHVPGLDFFSQYGIGIPAVWSLLVRLGLDGSTESLLPWAAGALVIYYFVTWRVLLSMIGHHAWAVLGMIMTMAMGLFGGVVFSRGTDSILVTPSSTVLRSPLDLLVLLFVLRAVTTASLRRRLAWVAISSVAVGWSVFWETDTGVWISLAFFTTVVSTVPRRVFSLDTVLVGVVSLSGALSTFWAITVAAYGERVLSMEFVKEMYYPLWLYSSHGLGAIWLSWEFEKGLDLAATNMIANILTPGLYAVAVAMGLAIVVGLRRNQRSRMGVGMLYLGILGFGLYHMYLNRSASANWYHSIHPAIMIGVVLFARLLSAQSALVHRARGQFTWLRGYVQVAVCLALLVYGFMFIWGNVHRGFLQYPNIRSYAWDRYRFQTNVRNSSPHFLAEEHKLGQELRKLTKPNEPVLVVSMVDTQVLGAAARPAAGGYGPPLETIVSKEILSRILGNLLRAPPNYAVYDKRKISNGFIFGEIFIPLRSFIEADYTLLMEVGPYEIWELKAKRRGQKEAATLD